MHLNTASYKFDINASMTYTNKKSNSTKVKDIYYLSKGLIM